MTQASLNTLVDSPMASKTPADSCSEDVVMVHEDEDDIAVHEEEDLACIEVSSTCSSECDWECDIAAGTHRCQIGYGGRTLKLKRQLDTSHGVCFALLFWFCRVRQASC